eukprot:1852434-Amphidinium_carterae.1
MFCALSLEQSDSMCDCEVTIKLSKTTLVVIGAGFQILIFACNVALLFIYKPYKAVRKGLWSPFVATAHVPTTQGMSCMSMFRCVKHRLRTLASQDEAQIIEMPSRKERSENCHQCQ